MIFPNIKTVEAKARSYLFAALLATILLSPYASYSAAYVWNISAADMGHARNAMNAASKERWADALAHARKAKDPLIGKMVTWRYLVSRQADASFGVISDFVARNPEWPEQETLLRRTEAAIGRDAPPPAKVEELARRLKETGRIALLGPEKQEPGASDIEHLVRESWTGQNVDSADREQAFLGRYGALLRENDHYRKIDRLLWEGNAKEAERLLSLVKGTPRALLAARIRLQREGSENAVRNVPESLRGDEGLSYDRARLCDRRGDAECAVNMLRLAPEHSAYAARWWQLKGKYIPLVMAERQYQLAYALAARNGFTGGGQDFAEAEWLAGWIALRYLDDAKAAHYHFRRLYDRVTTPTSLSRAAYWAGRAAERDADAAASRQWYEIAARYPTCFYGQLATEKIGSKTLLIPHPPVPSREDVTRYHANELAKAAYVFHLTKQYGLAKKFLKHAVMTARTAGEEYLIAQFGMKIGRPDYSVFAAKEALKFKGTLIPDANYPLVKQMRSPRGRAITAPEHGLIHSIILQESLYDPRAISSAGAMGLMQLMPATARDTAQKERLRYSREHLLSDPLYNITLGSRYLDSMITQFSGSYVLAVAAYNGGPGNVRKWIRNMGDPRALKHPEQIIDWIEMIPFEETKNYVQRVLENLQIYRFMLNRDRPPAVALSADLTRD